MLGQNLLLLLAVLPFLGAILAVTMPVGARNAEVLLGRYNLSRREHPLGETLMVDFARERELLAPLRAIADTVIDTTSLSAKQLSERVLQVFRLEQSFTLRLMLLYACRSMKVLGYLSSRRCAVKCPL